MVSLRDDPKPAVSLNEEDKEKDKGTGSGEGATGAPQRPPLPPQPTPLQAPALISSLHQPTAIPHSSAFSFTPLTGTSPVHGSPTGSPSVSRRSSMNQGYSGQFGYTTTSQEGLPLAPLSRRGSLAQSQVGGLSRRGSSSHPLHSGPRPPMFTANTEKDASNPATPSLLSRAGSPTLPLMDEKTRSRSSSFAGERPEFGGAFGMGGLGGYGMSALGGEGRRPRREGEFIGSIDCGTTSARFIIFDKQAKIITEHQSELPTSHPHPGWHSVNPHTIMDSINICIAGAIEKLEWMGWTVNSIKGIGITNMRETVICWEKETGEVLGKEKGEGVGIIWNDIRTVGIVREFEKKLEEEGIEIIDGETIPESLVNAAHTNGLMSQVMEKLNLAAAATTDFVNSTGLVNADEVEKKKDIRKGADALVDITGIPLSTYFSAIKLRWMIDHHADIKQAHDEDRLAFGTVDSWILYSLTGGAGKGLHMIDVTNASRTLLMNIHTLEWSPTLLNFFGIKASCLPKIVSSSEVYGKVATGPIQGVSIAGMIGDQQAALVGNKCLSKGEAKNTYGTGAFVLFNTGNDVVRSRKGLISTVAYKLGESGKAVYALEGSIAVAGSAIKWLRDQVGLIEDSSEMDQLCGGVKDAGGVYFVTGFSGLLAPYWDPNAAGMIIGLTQYTTSAHIGRATLDAVCYQTRAVLDVIEAESGTKLEELKVDGGVTNSDMAMQIQADLGGFRVCRPHMRESTALGSALLAGSALGLYGWDLSKPDTLSEVNTQEATIFEPELSEPKRLKFIRGWERAVERARAWNTPEDEDDAENEFEEEEHETKV